MLSCIQVCLAPLMHVWVVDPAGAVQNVTADGAGGHGARDGGAYLVMKSLQVVQAGFEASNDVVDMAIETNAKDQIDDESNLDVQKPCFYVLPLSRLTHETAPSVSTEQTAAKMVEARLSVSSAVVVGRCSWPEQGVGSFGESAIIFDGAQPSPSSANPEAFALQQVCNADYSIRKWEEAAGVPSNS